MLRHINLESYFVGVPRIAFELIRKYFGPRSEKNDDKISCWRYPFSSTASICTYYVCIYSERLSLFPQKFFIFGFHIRVRYGVRNFVSMLNSICGQSRLKGEDRINFASSSRCWYFGTFKLCTRFKWRK